MLFFLDVIGKALVTTQCFFLTGKQERKKILGNHPMIFFLDVQGEAEGGHSHFENNNNNNILVFKSEKTSRNHLMFFPVNVRQPLHA
jgi:hypothetical protein